MSKTIEEEKARVIIFGNPWCGDCNNSKRVLKANNISYHDINIEPEEAQADRDFVIKVNEGAMTVPVILFFASMVDRDQREGYVDSLTEPPDSTLYEKLLTMGFLAASV